MTLQIKYDIVVIAQKLQTKYIVHQEQILYLKLYHRPHLI